MTWDAAIGDGPTSVSDCWQPVTHASNIRLTLKGFPVISRSCDKAGRVHANGGIFSSSPRIPAQSHFRISKCYCPPSHLHHCYPSSSHCSPASLATFFPLCVNSHVGVKVLDSILSSFIFSLVFKSRLSILTVYSNHLINFTRACAQVPLKTK